MLFPELFKYAKGKDEEGKFTEEVILAPGLCAMFNKAFAEGAGIPDSWLKAYLVPILKGKVRKVTWITIEEWLSASLLIEFTPPHSANG